jgi:hypothetical protein
MIHKANFLLASGLMLLTLSSCKQHFYLSKKHTDVPKHQQQDINHVLAKYSDIPVPCGLTFVGQPALQDAECIENSCIIEAVAMQPYADVVIAYEHEMERLGWQRMCAFAGRNQALLVFNKPQRIAVISFSQKVCSKSRKRPSETQTMIVMSIGNREDV